MLALLLTGLLLAAYLMGYRAYIVMSGSMEPQISTGSLCLVDTNARYEDIRVGDVIVFGQYHGLVTHRVIAVTEEGLETKGDANEVTDGVRVNQTNFKGKTIGAIPGVGYFLHWLKRPLVQGIGVGLLIIMLFWEGENRQEDEEKD